ncbi:YpsA SLOG family protein [Demequina flava]|uniref:YpsA SLOG family protein n=1 Tax=Demequina flava TaxID=1095025 RepID=UPI000784AFBA|nr:putative molybdenum carrier protein [Demequina flava]
MDTDLRLISRIFSGGQTGADRAALDAAIKARVVHGGWCPAGGWAEDKPYPPGVLVSYPGLKPTIESEPEVRSRYNIRDSHATLVLGAVESSEGCQRGVAYARATSRPVLLNPSEPDEALEFLRGVGRDLIVNVAGPRESEAPGGYDRAREFMDELLASAAAST